MSKPTKNKRIPRTFNEIIGTILIDTNTSKAGDVLKVYKNETGSGYLSLNKRTGKYAYMFSSMLRNREIFEIEKVS